MFLELFCFFDDAADVGNWEAAKRSYPTSEVRGSGRVCQAATAPGGDGGRDADGAVLTCKLLGVAVALQPRSYEVTAWPPAPGAGETDQSQVTPFGGQSPTGSSPAPTPLLHAGHAVRPGALTLSASPNTTFIIMPGAG